MPVIGLVLGLALLALVARNRSGGEAVFLASGILPSGRPIAVYLVSSTRPDLVPDRVDGTIVTRLTELDRRIGIWAGAVGQPFPRVTSGYRSAALNSAIGGSSTSRHMTGEAADLVWADRRAAFVAWPEAARTANLPAWDQLIIYVHTGHIHVHTADRPRGQILVAERGVDGATTYQRFSDVEAAVAYWEPRRRAHTGGAL